MDNSTLTIVLFILNGLLGVVAFLGGFMLRDLSNSIKDLRKADERLSEKLADYVPKDEFREFRQEQSSNFTRMFDKLDELKDSISRKVDRQELPR